MKPQIGRSATAYEIATMRQCDECGLSIYAREGGFYNLDGTENEWWCFGCQDIQDRKEEKNRK